MEVLALMGDVMLGRLVNEALRHASPSFPWGNVLPLLSSANWRFCNLECVMSNIVPAGLPDKTFHFRSDARNVAVLKTAGIDMVSNANNHSLDFGPAAMLDMLAGLDEVGIAHAGAGANLTQARQAALSVTGVGTRIAVLACTDNEPRWAASDHAAGIHYVPADPDHSAAHLLATEVRRLRLHADIVIVSVHWGGNWGYEPPPEHRALGRMLVQAGADVVFGHSCHVFRGIEVMGRSVIIYSAGDFVDDYTVDRVERNDWSFVFLLEVIQGRVARLHLRPTVIKDLQARLAGDRVAHRIIAKMRDLCRDLGTSVQVSGDEAIVGQADADYRHRR
jgi:poly-gamma-glutamate capsule biosynthesis protein CapA/YwtB (metallophosphatase superfamily)